LAFFAKADPGRRERSAPQLREINELTSVATLADQRNPTEPNPDLPFSATRDDVAR
jgi:hypothetical protein